MRNALCLPWPRRSISAVALPRPCSSPPSATSRAWPTVSPQCMPLDASMVETGSRRFRRGPFTSMQMGLAHRRDWLRTHDLHRFRRIRSSLRILWYAQFAGLVQRPDRSDGLPALNVFSTRFLVRTPNSSFVNRVVDLASVHLCRMSDLRYRHAKIDVDEPRRSRNGSV